MAGNVIDIRSAHRIRVLTRKLQWRESQLIDLEIRAEATGDPDDVLLLLEATDTTVNGWLAEEIADLQREIAALRGLEVSDGPEWISTEQIRVIVGRGRVWIGAQADAAVRDGVARRTGGGQLRQHLRWRSDTAVEWLNRRK